MQMPYAVTKTFAPRSSFDAKEVPSRIGCSLDAGERMANCGTVIPRDIPGLASYSANMNENGAHIRLKLDTHEPIALTNFVGSFVGIGNQFDRFVSHEHPGVKMESEFFVKEVRAGCVEADLMAVVATAMSTGGLPGLIETIDKGQILQKFVEDVSGRLSRYFRPGGRDESASRSDLQDWLKTVGTIAADPNASGVLEAAKYHDGIREVTASFKFSSEEAREAQRQLSDHRKELENRTGADHKRVTLRFVRPSVELSKPGARGGERGIIELIHPRALPVFYASDLAEQRMRYDLSQLSGNVFRALFDVDVNVELNARGRPQAFRVVAVHSVTEETDDDDGFLDLEP
jgi:hypothetical protein